MAIAYLGRAHKWSHATSTNCLLSFTIAQSVHLHRFPAACATLISMPLCIHAQQARRFCKYAPPSRRMQSAKGQCPLRLIGREASIAYTSLAALALGFHTEHCLCCGVCCGFCTVKYARCVSATQHDALYVLMMQALRRREAALAQHLTEAANGRAALTAQQWEVGVPTEAASRACLFYNLGHAVARVQSRSGLLISGFMHPAHLCVRLSLHCQSYVCGRRRCTKVTLQRRMRLCAAKPCVAPSGMAVHTCCMLTHRDCCISACDALRLQ